MDAKVLDDIRVLSFFGLPCAVIMGWTWLKAHNQLKYIKNTRKWIDDNVDWSMSSEDKEKERLRELHRFSRQCKFSKAMSCICLYIFIFGFLGLSYLRAHFYI